eukprot:TRINITY_DN9972_c0_g2_i1.p1 TRINITY_DN9972_c0_g2~~TRINITY_DN9972_c0_g2_i1.p1  ORF type:complete len:720 (-),score=125.47 TRINITY_DN9972_c0_g2_i1:257-2416(-)
MKQKLKIRHVLTFVVTVAVIIPLFCWLLSYFNPPQAVQQSINTSASPSIPKLEKMSNQHQDAIARIKYLDREPVGPSMIEHFDRIPYRKIGFTTKQVSSYDPTGGNSDFNHFIAYNESHLLLLDEFGPGCVSRMYHIFTSMADQAKGLKWWIVVEVDGRIVMREQIMKIGAGIFYPYVTPLAGQHDARSGFFNYVPMFFKERLRIYIDSNHYEFPANEDPNSYFSQGYFYAFTLHKYSFDVSQSSTPTFLGKETDLSSMLDKFHLTFKEGKKQRISTLPVDYKIKESQKISLGENILVDMAGSGAIIYLRIKLNSQQPEHYEKIMLRAKWDHAEIPQVDVPFGIFFFTEDGQYESESYTNGHLFDQGGYCLLPMPFWKHAQISLVSPFSEEIDVEFELELTTLTYDQRRAGYFHATFHDENPYARYKDYPFFEDSGRWGHVVGLYFIMRRVEKPLESDPYEGDERFYIDGSKSPAIHGTGTEDYFNTGHFYFHTHEFCLPFHGNTYYNSTSRQRYNLHVYRLNINDFITYRDSIIMGIETVPGTWGSSEQHYTSLALHYSGTKSGLLQTDELDVGDSESETRHKYKCEECSEVYTAKGQYEARYAKEKISDTGRRIGTSSFKVAINPSNEGVLLRRRIDHSFQNQKAKVFVDGKFAGIWFEMKKNSVYIIRDSDFWIPREFTKAKSEIQIRLESFYEGTNQFQSDKFTEFHYWIFCEMP